MVHRWGINPPTTVADVQTHVNNHLEYSSATAAPDQYYLVHHPAKLARNVYYSKLTEQRPCDQARQITQQTQRKYV